MKNITAKTVFSYMTPSALVDFMSSLPYNLHQTNCAKCAEVAIIREMAYNELVLNAGQQDADDMLAEWKSS